MITAATQTPWLRIATVVTLLVGALAGWAFVLRYASRFRWWRTDIGRDLVAFSASLATFYSYAALAAVWPSLPGALWIQGALGLLITGLVIARLIMFERLTRTDARKQLPTTNGGDDHKDKDTP